MARSREKARRRRLAVILSMPLLAGIILRWPTEVFGCLFLYRLIPIGTIPLPNTLGLYGLDRGRLVRFEKNGNSLDFSPWVEFVFYSEASLYPSSRWTIKRIIPQIDPINPRLGQPLWTQWLDQLERYGRQSSDWIRWTVSDKHGIRCWTRAVSGQRATVRMIPAVPLSPGWYELTGTPTSSPTTFSVQFGRLAEEYAAPVRKAVARKHWVEGLRAAELLRAYGVRDSQVRGDIEEIRVRLAVKVAQEAMSADRWDDAQKALNLVEKLQAGDPEFEQVKAEVTYHNAMIAARDALAKQDWDEAAGQSEAALAAKPDDWQAQNLYERIPRLPFAGVQPAVWFTGFSPDGLTLVSLDGNRVLTLWSVASRKPLKTHQFDPSLRALHGSEDFTQWVGMVGEQVFQVDLDTREKNIILRGNVPGNKWVVQRFVANDKGTLLAIEKCWTQQELKEWGISDRFNAETGVEFGNAVVIWNLTEKKATSLVAPAPQRPPFGYLAFGPKSTDLFAVDQNGDIVSFNLERGEITRTFPTAMKGTRIRLLPDKEHLLCFNDARVKVLSVASGETVIDLPNPEKKITNVSISSSLRLMAIASKGDVQLWGLNPTRPLRTLQEGQGVTINDVALSPDCSWLAVASNRNRSPLGLWRLTPEEQSLAKLVSEEPEEATPQTTPTHTPPPIQEPTLTEVQAVVALEQPTPPASAVIPSATGTTVPVYGSAAWNEMLEAARAKTKLMQVDEGPADPGFAEFRSKLAQTVESRDAISLLSVVSDDILNTTGEERGKKAFRSRWKPEDPQSEVWRQLGDILKLGGRFNPSRTTFTAPFVYTELHAAADQIEEIGVILGKDVSLRSAPSAKSRLVEKRSHEIVKLEFGESPWFEDQDGGEYPWFGVGIPGSDMAFVSARFIRCPLDYHARFEKMRTVWRMTEFACEWPRGR